MVSGRDFLGSYRLVKIIRAGSQCDVWEAIKDPDPTRIAIKVLLRELVKNRDLVSQLKHEADVGMSCKHRNVIRIHEYNFDHEMPFIAMDLFSSRNLKQDLRERPVFVAYYASEILEQCAEGLGHLHAKGWIHCDVKPDNFLMNDDGVVKLIDFSIAQREKKRMGGGLFGKKQKIKGTRSYMSPEQIRAKPLDGRADIYSLGCQMYELLAGRTPYSGANPDDLLMKHLRSAVPALTAANERVTPEYSALVQRCMAKDRDARPSNMFDLLKELRKTRVYKTGMKPPSPEGVDEAEDDE